MESLDPTLSGIVLALLSLAGVYLGVRRGAQADVRADSVKSTAQVYTGYSTLLQDVQTDNRDLRTRLDVAYAQIDALRARLDVAIQLIEELKQKALNGRGTPERSP